RLVFATRSPFKRHGFASCFQETHPLTPSLSPTPKHRFYSYEFHRLNNSTYGTAFTMTFILSSPVSHYSHYPQNHYQRYTPTHSSPLAPKSSFTNPPPPPPSSPLSNHTVAPPRRCFKPNPLRAN